MYTNISVVGLGYIGLPTAAVFAAHGINVVGVDVNPAVVDTINQGRIHIVEPLLDAAVETAVSSGRLRASVSPEPAQAFLVAVPTPFQGENRDPDLKYIKSAAEAIAPVLEAGNLVVLESTSPVGATHKMAEWLAAARPDLTFPQTHGGQSDIRVAHCPERVLPGKVLEELVSNDRVIGGMTSVCSAAAKALYETFVEGSCVVTDAKTAEMTKLTENSFRDVNIAFANELSMICDELEIDVWKLIALANRHPRVNILQPGAGVGGHCIAVDPWFIVSSAPETAKLIGTARRVNDAKPVWVLDKVEALIGRVLSDQSDKTAKDLSVAIYGITFKPDIDDIRESPALDIARTILARTAGPVMIVEPNLQTLPNSLSGANLVDLYVALAQADVHVLLVDHEIFKASSAPNGAILDVRGIWR